MRLSGLVPAALSAALLLTCAACSQQPSRVNMAELDPTAAAGRAIAQYDTDGDGQLSEQEFSASPGLASARQQFDANGDGSMTQEEIAARLQSWIDSKSALHIIPVQVNWRGQGLAGATVKFIPEEFLGDAFKPAQGETNNYGLASPTYAPEDRPDPEFDRGIGTGLYRVEISKQEDGKEIIPAKYNTQTTLGQEIAPGGAGMGGVPTFNLTP